MRECVTSNRIKATKLRNAIFNAQLFHSKLATGTRLENTCVTKAMMKSVEATVVLLFGFCSASTFLAVMRPKTLSADMQGRNAKFQ